MKIRIYRTLVLLVFLCIYHAQANAASCTYRPWDLEPGERSLERYFVNRMCSQPTVDKFWNTFGFRSSYWDDGFGFHDVCNWQKPLGRMMGSLFLLENSFSPRASSLNDWSGDAVKWAYPYSGTVYRDLDDLRGRCSNGSAAAATYRGAFVNDRIEFYFNGIYNMNAIERAASVLHEGHHYGGRVSHSCNSGQDRNWSDWRPYASDTYYAISYYWNANSHTNASWKEYAADYADARIANRFCNVVPAWVRNFR